MAKEKCKALEVKSAGTQHRHRHSSARKLLQEARRQSTKEEIDGEASLHNGVAGLQEMEASLQAAKRGAD
jgi:hypothetical protein